MQPENDLGGIQADEVGIRFAIVGDIRLRTALQPIFVLSRQAATISGVRAYMQPSRQARPMEAAEFYAAVPRVDRSRCDRMVARLHAENRLNAGVEEPGELDLWIGIDTGVGVEAAEHQISAIAAATDAASAARIVCEIMRSETLEHADANWLVAHAHRCGMRACIDAIGADWDGSAPLDADFVKMRGTLFRDLARVRRAALLIGHLVEASRGRGASVLIDGIETRAQLVTAIEAGATHVQGFLFGAPALAGTIIDETPRHLVDILYGEEMVANSA